MLGWWFFSAQKKIKCTVAIRYGWLNLVIIKTLFFLGDWYEINVLKQIHAKWILF